LEETLLPRTCLRNLSIALLACTVCAAQVRTVALTFDDLPAVRAADPADAGRINRAILDSLEKHHVPATAFVIEERVQSIGTIGKKILKSWLDHGHELGNHTFSHQNFTTLTLEQFKQEVVLGEASIRPLLAARGEPLRHFRFPYNHSGDTPEKHQAAAAFLSKRNYTIATCTIENVDYEFARSYDEILAAADRDSAKRLRAEYLTFTSAEID